MNSKTLTWALVALAFSLAAVLAVVLVQRPDTAPETAPAPATSAPQDRTTAVPSDTATPTTQQTDTTAEGGPSPLPSSEVEAHDAIPGATPYSQTGDARRDWEPVATGFGRAFTATKGKNAAQWRATLSPFVTPKVTQQIATIDIRNVPAGTFTSIEAAEFGEDKVAVYVRYNDTALTLVTYLVDDGARWRIYAYDRWED